MHRRAPFRPGAMQASFLQPTSSPTLSPPIVPRVATEPQTGNGAGAPPIQPCSEPRAWTTSAAGPPLGSAGPGGCLGDPAGPGFTGRGADRQGHTGAGWSWAVITGEGRRGGEPGHPDPSTAPHGPAHATSGRTWLAASPAAALRRRHPGSGSDPSWARPPSRTSPAAAAPPKRLPIGSWRVRFRGERSPGRPSNRAPLRPSAQLPCKAAELASQGESQSRDSLSNPSPSSECGFLPGRGGKGAFPWSGWTRSPWGGGARRHPPASGSPRDGVGLPSLSLVRCLSGFVSFTVPDL